MNMHENSTIRKEREDQVRTTPQQIIDEHMQKVARRVIDVFEDADEDALAEDVMQDVFAAIGLVEAFTHSQQNEGM